MVTAPGSAPKSASALQLGEKDIQRLLTEETPDIRIDVLKKIAEAHHLRRYSLRELAVAEQIFRVLIQDTEISVREALADTLKDNPNVPRDIIISLTRDVDSVALPVIEYSDVLTDDDLIGLIQMAKTSGRPVAVASRREVSQAVSDVVLETHNIRAVTQLIKNPKADISEKAFPLILRDHGNNTDLMNALATRADLSITVVEKVITLVSDSLADSLRVRYNISPATIAVETEKTRELATLKLAEGVIAQKDVERLVDQLKTFGRLTPSIILTSLCRGNLFFFETSLARLSNIPVRNAQLLIHDKGNLGFKALYAKAGLPEKFFAASQLLLEVVSENQRAHLPRDSDGLVQKLIARSSGKNVEHLAYFIALIRQNG